MDFTEAQLFSCQDGQEPDWSEFDALELHGGALIEYGDGQFTIETGVDDDEVEAYSIQAHLKGGGTDDIADVRTYDEAIAILAILEARSGLSTHHFVEMPKSGRTP